mmetsp:Transcript_54503/g.151942  ORF Transcript_54503/g.151942 Transcript_54503/m.151942 type:complete len:440 (+) Transcript_54503:39-1358(+)
MTDECEPAAQLAVPPCIVADVGAAASRFGISAEVAPRFILDHVRRAPRVQEPAAHAGALRRPYAYADVAGLSLDADALEACLRAGLERLPRVDGGTPSVLLVEPSQVSSRMRCDLAEVLFERLDIAQAFVSKRAALGAYARGHTTALVLDVGASHSCGAAVVDGWVVPERVLDCGMGGDLLDEVLLARLRSSGGGTSASAGDTTASAAKSLEFARSLKEARCTCDPGAAGSASYVAAVGSGGQSPLCLPDGTPLGAGSVASALREIPDFLFGGDTCLHCRRPGVVVGQQALETYRGLQYLLAGCFREQPDASVTLAAPMLRRLGLTVILTGGGACLAGCARRLRAELQSTGSWSGELARVQVLGNSSSWCEPERVLQPPERAGILPSVSSDATSAVATTEHSCWTGGSIVASLGSFQQLLVTRAEYKERGVNVLADKCP